MDKPRILISLSKTNKGDTYANAITKAGGETVLEYAYEGDELYDGLLLSGGGDVASFYFGEENDGSNEPDLLRDKTELALCEKYVKAGKPILGICRGCQLINVYFGGTIIQDIHTAASHKSGNPAKDHRVVNVEGSIAYELFGKEMNTNTSHHQALKVPGVGIKITQYSKKDGIIEGFEHESLPIFATQYHPELMLDGRTPDATEAIAIFERFVDLCKK